MTIREKLGQLTQYSGEGDEYQASEDQLDAVRQGEVGSFLNVLGAEYTREVQRIALEESRLGIPLLFAFDVIHGYRTISPIPLAEASTWNPDLVSSSARIAAVEATSAGLHWTFAPMVDIAPDPRWGRIAEGSGEDPYLSAVMAVARVKGFQGGDLREHSTLLACAKHFAAYGGAQGGRDYNTVDISRITLYEYYLPPFRAAVQSGVGTLMSAFNEIGGIPMTANRELATDLLRDQWEFKGFVVSDWTSILELINHGIAGTRAEAGINALTAGVDMDMVAGIYREDLPAQVELGNLSEDLINRSVRRVLAAKMRLGLFDDPYHYCNAGQEESLILAPEHLDLVREVARQSIVLLKNDGRILPLSKDLETIAVIGPLADDKQACLGPWHGRGQVDDVISILEGIKSAVRLSTHIQYAKGCDVTGEDRGGFQKALSLAQAADVVILVLGETREMSGEAASRADIGLPGVQLELAKSVLATGIPTVVLLMNGRPLAIPWLAENAPAIVETWLLGVQAGPAVADMIFGDYNPGGKLPVSFPLSIGQIPVTYRYKRTGRPMDPDNKYTSKYIDMPNTPLYPFGHGLSYTEFDYRNLAIFPTEAFHGDTVVVSFEIANEGIRGGDAIWQLYVNDPVAGVTRPVMELKGFSRVSLAPGEVKRITVHLPVNMLAYYNKELQPIVEPGEIGIMVGHSSMDIPLRGSLRISGTPTTLEEKKVYFSKVAGSPAHE
jgi:beta-glucosidase